MTDRSPAPTTQTAPAPRTAPVPTSAPARTTRTRAQRPSSTVELEIPSAIDPKELVVTAVVPLQPGTGLPDLPGFLLEGISCDVQPHGRDWKGRPTSVLVSAPVDLTGKTPGTFAQLRLEATGDAYQPSQVRDIPALDLEFVLQTPDGIFRAKPFADVDRGVRTLGRHRSTWTSFAILEGARGDSRGLVHASVELRVDGLAVVEFFAVNGLQLYSESSAHGGDFCYQEFEAHTTSALVLPMPRKGEHVVRDGSAFVLRMVDDGLIHLWPRMQGALRRVVLAPPDASPALLQRAVDVGRFFGSAFAVSGPNSWIECPSHGPEQAFLAPWTDALDVWGPKGQAGARELLNQAIGGIWAPRTSGLATSPFIVSRTALFHPLGQFQEGEPGGWKIRPVGSFALDRRLLVQRWIELEHTLDRTRAFHFEPRTGKVTTAPVWAQKFGGRVPFVWMNHGDRRFPWMSLPRDPQNGSILRTPNVTQGRMVSHGDDHLLTFDEHDDQHGVREREPAETVARFGGSPIALLILESFAANAELARHELQSPQGDVTLAKLLAETAKAPASGSTNAGRALAWDLAAIAGFWEFASDGWRTARRGWVQAFTTWVLTTRGACGLLASDPDTGHVTEVAKQAPHNSPAGFRYVQTFEEAYLNFALEKLGALALPAVVSSREYRNFHQGIVDSFEALWSVRLEASDLVPLFVAVGFAGGSQLQALSRDRTSDDGEGTWIWGLIACAARCSLRAGNEAGYQSILQGPLLQAGRPVGTPAPSMADYVRAAQALEREPWHGSVDYSATAWGEAWAISRGAPTGTPPARLVP